MKTAVSYSTICEEELLTGLVPLYLIENPTVCRFWHRGGADIYQVHTNVKHFVLRVYRHGTHTRDDIEFEVAALNFLNSKGAKIAYPIARRDGGYITELHAPEGLRYAIITTHAKGMEPGYCGRKQVYENDAKLFGESVAEVHQLSSGFEANHKRHKLDIDYLYGESVENIRNYILTNPLQTDHDRQACLHKLDTVLPEVDEHINAIQVVGLDAGFCHGDCHGSNVHNNSGVLTQFDFEDCAFGYRVYDLATFRWAIDEEENKHELWPPFLAGYKSVRQPTPEDLQAMPLFVALRQLWWIAFIVRNLKDFGHDDGGHNLMLKQLSRVPGMLNES